MNLDEFKSLDPEAQQAELAARRRQCTECIEGLVRDELADYYQSTLIPKIEFKKSAELPPVRDRDEVVRELMRADTSIREIQTADGVIYRR